MILTFLNIPNFCVSFYLMGLSKHVQFRYNPNQEFSQFDFKPIAIFDYNGKLVVVDNSDPVGVNPKLLEFSDYYFATNKLKCHSGYKSEKILPLAPHYPVNALVLFLKTFWKKLPSSYGKNIIKEAYRLQNRPDFKLEPDNFIHGKKLFFAGSIWKNEPEANNLRYFFIKTCKANPRLDFEGGFLPRDNGDNLGFDDAIAPKKYSPKEFLELSKRSLFGFNNPAVLGALSWRFAEYLNIGVPILSMPYKVDLLEYPVHGTQIHMIDDIEELPDFLNFVLSKPEYLNRLSKGGKAYFIKNCLPEIQGQRIIDLVRSGY